MLVSLLDYKSLSRVINFYCAVYYRYTDLSYKGLWATGMVWVVSMVKWMVGVILLFSWSRLAQSDHGVSVVGIVPVVRVVLYSGSAGWSLVTGW